MTSLRLGPLLRYVDEDTATVWVETDGPCEAEVRCEGSPAGGIAATWQVSGHHYALITVVGLEPGTETAYRVLLDGAEVWPPPAPSAAPPAPRPAVTTATAAAATAVTATARAPLPPSTIRTPAPDGRDPLRLAFGSCRWAARPADSRHDPAGPDALEALAGQALAGAELPDVLLLLGDQIYADETSEAVRARLAERRDLTEPPGPEVADYEEYTELYYESWLVPEVRWLLSTVPTCMIFDDHDIVDDWNTSEAWQRDIRATPWWRERLLGGLTSYWVHQHLGNLSPGELADDKLYAAVRAAGDGTALLREFAERADADPMSVRWSYRRDFGRVRLLMTDTRAARVLDEDRRAMLDPAEMTWLREQALTDRESYDHLLIGSSLPWLLPPAVHDAEAWNAALCAGARGPRLARFGERLRRASDLEHWAAFPESFRALAELVAEVGSGDGAPATVCVLSGDVHHAYVAEPLFAPPHFAEPPAARVLQLTCSPMHNSIPAFMRAGFRLGWSGGGRLLGRLLARHGRTAPAPLSWQRTGGPWFGNHLMTLTLHGRASRLGLHRAGVTEQGVRLAEVLDREVTAAGESSPT